MANADSTADAGDDEEDDEEEDDDGGCSLEPEPDSCPWESSSIFI